MPPTLARETHCPMAPLFLPAVPSLAPCHRLLPIQSREKEKKRKNRAEMRRNRATSRNGTFYRSGIKPRGKHYSHDNKLWILRIPQTGLESRPEMGFESIYSNGYTISYTVSNDIIGFHFN